MNGINLKQIKTLPEYHQAIKTLAQHKQIKIQDVCNNAVQQFLKVRDEKEGTYREYLSSPSKGQYQSYWFSTQLLRSVKLVSEEDHTSENRVLYTALYLFIQESQVESVC